MPTYTANYNLAVPTVNADANVWGTLTNANWPIIDTQLKTLNDGKLGYNAGTYAVAQRVNFTHANVQRGGVEIADRNWVTSQISGAASAVIPTGLFCMWSGLLTAIPTGWALCNGANGTPDLRSKFVMGAANNADPGATGGATTHDHGGSSGATTLTLTQIPSHNHGVSETAHTHTITDKSHTHTTVAHNHAVTITDPGHYHAINRQYADHDYSSHSNSYYGPDVVGHTASDTYDEDQGVKREVTGITATTANHTVVVNSAFTGITGTQGATTGITVNNAGGGGSHVHTIADANHLPPYYALAFIMKLAPA